MDAPLSCGTQVLDLRCTQVMGILNVTPDSFSDGGRFLDHGAAVAQAAAMVEQGATIIDVGGESTRPGAAAVDVNTEIERVVPAIETLRSLLPQTVLSVDTSKPEVMRAAVAAGANLINDVRALQLPGALQAAAETNAAVCVMHMQGEPQTMQRDPHYDDVVGEVIGFLRQRLDACLGAGIGHERLLVDPGFGFGKTLEHNLILLDRLAELQMLGCPVLVGMSRKRMLGTILDRPVTERVHGGVAAAVIAASAGARVVRTHDVGPTVEALRVLDAVRTHGRACRAENQVS